MQIRKENSMEKRLAENIMRLRKARGFTQEELAKKLSISPQAVSKWENALSMPDISLLPALAGLLRTDIDTLMGYIPDQEHVTSYEERYDGQEYYWGTKPNEMCFEVLRRYYPVKPLKLLEIGCGEGRDAVFFAKNGYQVTAFDVTESGIEKAKRLADLHRAQVRFFRADLRDFRPDEDFDIIYSSGVFHHIEPKLRGQIMDSYIEHTAAHGLHAINVFVEKTFIAPPPDPDEGAVNWISGELFTYYRDWLIEECREEVFDCMSSGVLHKHCMDIVYARKV